MRHVTGQYIILLLTCVTVIAFLAGDALVLLNDTLTRIVP